ncbi:hypothetical protein ACP6PM_10690 [Dapis sp. BLCC M229]
MRIQNPVRLNDNSEPEPDISLLQRRQDFYQTQHPQPEDIFLLIEVSDIAFPKLMRYSCFSSLFIPTEPELLLPTSYSQLSFPS